MPALASIIQLLGCDGFVPGARLSLAQPRPPAPAPAPGAARRGALPLAEVGHAAVRAAA